jgi:hypothetical protein
VSTDPRNWQIDVPQANIDLYLELHGQLRPLSSDEAQMMVELIDAWRGLEHRKHIALEEARANSRS